MSKFQPPTPDSIPRLDSVSSRVHPTTRRSQRSVVDARRGFAGTAYGLPGQTKFQTRWI
jgi:hypothetical protein